MATTMTPAGTDARLREFSVSDAAIAQMEEEYLPLTIAGVNDVDGFKRVHDARMVVKGKRCEVERVRKALKADALEYGRKVDAEAKRITALLEPIESHLAKQEDAYVAEKERIKNEARLKAEAEARAKAEAEAARIRAEQEAEAERLRIDREKLEAERAMIEAERAAIAAAIAEERRVIEAERRRLQEIEAARLRAEEMERARLRAEALRPDKEKLLGVAEAVKAIPIPSVSADASGAAERIRQVILRAAAQVSEIASSI